MFESFDQTFTEWSASHGKLLREIADLLGSDEWMLDGARDLATWVAARGQISGPMARDLVRQAEALVDRPGVAAASCAGEISPDQCKALCVLEDGDVWLESLPFWSYSELEREARKQKAREAEERDGGIYFRTQHTKDERFLRGEFQLHPHDGAAVIAAIDDLIPTGVKLRDYDRAAADALVKLAKGEQAQPPIVVLSIEDDVAALKSGGFISAETAARLACDSRVQVGLKTSRTIPANMRRAVEVRDHGACAFPECGMTTYLEIHHIVPVAEGGPTVIANLITTCWRHHDLIHKQHWALAGEPGPNIKWVRPDGTIFEPRVVMDTS